MHSDFYDPQGLDDGLRYLTFRGFEVMVLQLSDGRLLQADHWGDLSLVDCETGERRELCLTPELLAAYEAALAEFSAGIANAAREVGARHLRVDVSTPFDQVIMKVFRSGGFLG